MAVCAVWLPRSVAKPAKTFFLNCSMSAGAMSCAMTIIGSNSSALPFLPLFFSAASASSATADSECALPVSTFRTRSTTCSTSARRDAMYSSSIILELLDHGLQLGGECPLCVVASLADQARRLLGQQRILEDQSMQVDERGELGRRAGRQLGLQLIELVDDVRDGLVEPRDLGLDLAFHHHVVRHLERGRGQQVHAADDDAARDRDAVER